MNIINIKEVLSICTVCNKPFIPSTTINLTPLGYIPGLCSLCNTDILKRLISMHYPILKYSYLKLLGIDFIPDSHKLL